MSYLGAEFTLEGKPRKTYHMTRNQMCEKWGHVLETACRYGRPEAARLLGMSYSEVYRICSWLVGKTRGESLEPVKLGAKPPGPRSPFPNEDSRPRGCPLCHRVKPVTFFLHDRAKVCIECTWREATAWRQLELMGEQPPRYGLRYRLYLNWSTHVRAAHRRCARRVRQGMPKVKRQPDSRVRSTRLPLYL